MKETIHVKWNTGHMTILLDGHFPTTKSRLKKLLTKVIRLDWENQAKLRETLMLFFQEKQKAHQYYFESCGKKYLDRKQKTADLMRLVDDRKRPNGLHLTGREWKRAKDDLKESRAEERRLLSATKKHQQAVKDFQGNIEVLQAEISKFG